jgi:hypothetical protein
MTFWQAQPYAVSGQPIRRSSWLASASLFSAQVRYERGAGTARAVAVYRLSGVDSVVTPTTVTAADLIADDWEVVP